MDVQRARTAARRARRLAADRPDDAVDAERLITYGLGFSPGGQGDSLVFEHGGSNGGFRAYMAAVAGSGGGVVVMTNGENGASLGGEILRSVAREYGLPTGRANVRDAIPMDAAALASYPGTYVRPLTAEGQRPFTIELRLEGGVLRANVPAAGW